MSKLINLGRAKKQKERVKKRAKGDQNAVLFGRSKAEIELQTQRTKRRKILLEQHKLETDK